MAIRNSNIRSSSFVLCSLAALTLWAACGTDQGPPGGTAGAAGSPPVGTAGAPAVAGGAGSPSAGAPPATAGAGGSPATAGAPAVAGGGNSSGGAAPVAGAGPTAGAGPSAGAGPVGGAGPTGDYNPDFVEFYGKDCAVTTPTAGETNAKLPDLFKSFAGTRISKKSDWKCRRAELKKAVETFIHGEKPGRPETVTGSVTATSIKVHVENGGKSIDFSVSVSLPGSAGPYPIIIGLGGGNLPAALLKEEGVGTANYNNGTMASESSRSGLFTNIYGSTGASAQIGWAWGVSRIIDVLVDEKAAGRNNFIDPKGVGVTGCSRLGKGAFTIGAFDERIALGIPQESGTGGVSAFRVVNTAPVGENGKPAQSLDGAWTEAQGWFGTVFGSNRSKVNTLPVDTHSMVAMYAPRGLLVLDNSRIGELCPTCQHAASAAGAEVYKALGVPKNIEYNGGNAADPHDHCTFYMASQGEPLKRAIRAFLTKKAPADGRIAPAAVGTADLTKWIDGTTPTLE